MTFKAEPSRFPWATLAVPIFNLEPAKGEPARFGFEFEQVPITIDTSVLTGGNYAVKAEVKNSSEAAEVFNATISVWGVPGSPVHDGQRGWGCIFEANPEECIKLENKHPEPYLTLPTYCSKPLVSSVQAQSWEPGAPLLAPVTYEQAPLVGCNSLPFTPSLSVRPDQKTASTPTGLTVEVKIPQEPTLSANGVAEADVKETELTFPEGLQANAGAADGLETCSVGAMGFEGSEGETPESGLESTIERQPFTTAAPTCPDASKIGEVEVHSPLLEHNLKGFAYLAGQDTNPFKSPLVLYFFAEDPISGVRVKLAGETRILPNGQLVGVFKNTPPLPSEIITLHLFDGPRASLATPPYCRPYEAKARFVTWSGQEATRTSSFTPEGGPNGSTCQSSGPLPFSPAVQGRKRQQPRRGVQPIHLHRPAARRPGGHHGRGNRAPTRHGRETGLGHPVSGTGQRSGMELRARKRNRSRPRELGPRPRPRQHRGHGVPDNGLQRRAVRPAGADAGQSRAVQPRLRQRAFEDRWSTKKPPPSRWSPNPGRTTNRAGVPKNCRPSSRACRCS